MNIQIFGTKKCSETRKAERYFKERRIPFQAIDLGEKGISRGELESVVRSIPVLELIDEAGKLYRAMNLGYMQFDTFEKLLECPLLLVTPIVRNGRLATKGFVPEVWARWE